MIYPWHLYLMAGMYVLAGSMHFVFPRAYLRIMPTYLPAHKSLVLWSGIAEMALGVALCFPTTKNWSIWGIIVMLTLFLTVSIFTCSKVKRKLRGYPNGSWSLGFHYNLA